MVKLDAHSLIQQTGGCGRYQIILTLIVHSMKCVVCFSMVLMVFGKAAPDWWCMDGLDDNVTLANNSTRYKSCQVQNENETRDCTRFKFADDMRTVVSEWSLVCDNDWVPSTIISVQMLGILFGNLACGQVADLIGRKPPLYFSQFSLIVLNIASTFSYSWVMFTAIRCLIGIAMGMELTVQYNIASESTYAKWRTWVVTIPSWTLEIALFALVSWATMDWKLISYVTAAIGIPLLFTFCFVSESFRWYIGHDRLDDAKRVIEWVAKVNGKPAPDMTDLEIIDEEESCTKSLDKKYTFVDLFRHRELLKLTLLFLFLWVSMGLGAYGVQFGLPALTGSLFLNMFILGLVGIPVQFGLIYLQNRLGRQRTAILMYLIVFPTALFKAVTELLEDSELLGKLGTAAVIVSLTALNGAWSPIQTLTIETYPTVVRNIGYGTQNMMARVGAIIGPQLAFLDVVVPGVMYWTCCVISLVSIFLLTRIPETGQMDLKDKIGTESNIDNKEGEGHKLVNVTHKI